jgi:hypothetical protein
MSLLEQQEQLQEDFSNPSSSQPTVIQNSDILYKKPFEVVDHVELRELNEFEKDMLKGTFTPKQLLEHETTETTPQTDHKRDYITMVKVISLDRLGKNPLANPSFFRRREKEELKLLMEHIIGDMSEEEIQKEFNEVCCEKLFTAGADYSCYSIYK